MYGELYFHRFLNMKCSIRCLVMTYIFYVNSNHFSHVVPEFVYVMFSLTANIAIDIYSVST